MFNIYPRKQVSPHLRGAPKPYMYRKPGGKIYKLKKRPGTFSLSNQVVWDSFQKRILEYITVKGVTVREGIKHGRVSINHQSFRVKQLGTKAWMTI